MSTRRYSEQFKREAVRLVVEEGYSCKAAGKLVGVCHTSVAGWVRRMRDQMPEREKFASAQEELEHLRSECLRLRMERDILKKAAAFFAKEEGS